MEETKVGSYTEVNIDKSTEENVTLELTKFGATWNTIGLTLQA